MRPIYLKMTAFGPYGGTEEIDLSQLGTSGIYLVTGPTGSGKTTVFDAICFALYSELSSDNRAARSFQSQHRKENMETEVVLTFEARGREYKVTRKFKRVKKRGTGEYEFSGNVVSELVGDDGQMVTGEKNVNARIKELLGLGIDQFKKIVMLAQGEFRKFLEANTSEKSAIFSAIFNTSTYHSIADRLVRAHKNAIDAAHDLETEVAALLGNSIASGSGRETEFESNLTRGIYGASDAVNVLQEITRDDEDRLEKVSEELERLNEMAVGIGQRKTRAEMMSKAAERLEDARAKSELARRSLPQLEEMHQKQKGLEPERRRLADRIAVERNGLGAYDEADKLRHELDKTVAERARFERTAAASEKRIGEIENLLEECSAKILAGERADEEKGVVDENIGVLDSRIGKLSDLERWCRDAERAIASHSEKAGAYAESSDKLDEASAQSRRLEKLFLDSQAGILASTLADGTACPVCGSTSHPSPACTIDDVPSAEELDCAKSEEEQRRSDATCCAIEAASALTERNLACERVLSLAAEALPEDSHDEAAALGTADAMTANPVDPDGDERRDQEPSFATMRDQDLSSIVASIESHAASTMSQLESEKASLDQKSSELAETIRQATDAAGKRAKLEDSLSETKEALADAHSGRERQAATCEQLERQIEAMRSSLRFETRAEAETELEKLEKDAQGMKASLDAAAAAVERCRKQIQSADEMIAANEKVLENQVPEDLATILEEEKETSGKRKDADELKTALSSRIDNNKAIAKKASARIAEFEKADEKRTMLKTLSDTASGKVAGSSKITLETYVQTVFFDQMIAFANNRLGAMSSGRYEFERKLEKSGGGQQGLDIDVRDNDTGGSRPASTLSGGESFMASMSLALGLSDTVQNNAGGISLDCMFIDEGFGSLDEELLDLVVNVLTRISENDKLIGIISHVEELKRVIPYKLVVEKGRDGSHISMQLP